MRRVIQEMSEFFEKYSYYWTRRLSFSLGIISSLSRCGILKFIVSLIF
jgi:hypothetical protein